MINHVSIGVREIGRARRFYDAALGPLGYRRLSEGADSLGYGRDGIAFWLLARRGCDRRKSVLWHERERRAGRSPVWREPI